MNSRDRAAMVAARNSRPLPSVHLNEGTDFVIKVLDWILVERAANRLTQGAPVTLVLFDFLFDGAKPLAASLGEKVDLQNGQGVSGAIHLCAPNLRPAHVLPDTGTLSGLDAHQLKLAERQMTTYTCVTFDPASGMLQVRLSCAPTDDPLVMHLGSGLSPSWPSQDLGPLTATIEAFHAMIDPDDGLGRLLLDEGPGARARIYYRYAMFLYLRYQVGLRETSGFRVKNRSSDVKVIAIGTGETSLIQAASMRSSQVAAAAMIDRLVAEATLACDREGSNMHISCLSCPSSDPPNKDCASPPVSLHHRHIKAA